MCEMLAVHAGGAWEMIATALHSWDRSVFDLILRDARNIRRIEVGNSATLRLRSSP
jgi:hypothetical protein